MIALKGKVKKLSNAMKILCSLIVNYRSTTWRIMTMAFYFIIRFKSSDKSGKTTHNKGSCNKYNQCSTKKLSAQIVTKKRINDILGLALIMRRTNADSTSAYHKFNQDTASFPITIYHTPYLMIAITPLGQ